jgi:hypothetical protein
MELEKAKQRTHVPYLRVTRLSNKNMKKNPKDIMNKSGIASDLLTHLAHLPIRKGKRPVTIRGPLHVQCSDNHHDRLLRELVKEVATWPGIDTIPSPAGSGELVSLRIEESLASQDSSNFIIGQEFARVLFGAPTIYLTLPLSCAHWAIVRGWAEPHYSGSFGLMPPGVMVVYAPRDENEKAVCRSLFLISYHSALADRSNKSSESYMLRKGLDRSRQFEEAVA